MNNELELMTAEASSYRKASMRYMYSLCRKTQIAYCNSPYSNNVFKCSICTVIPINSPILMMKFARKLSAVRYALTHGSMFKMPTRNAVYVVRWTWIKRKYVTLRISCCIHKWRNSTKMRRDWTTTVFSVATWHLTKLLSAFLYY